MGDALETAATGAVLGLALSFSCRLGVDAGMRFRGASRTTIVGLRGVLCRTGALGLLSRLASGVAVVIELLVSTKGLQSRPGQDSVRFPPSRA